MCVVPLASTPQMQTTHTLAFAAFVARFARARTVCFAHTLTHTLCKYVHAYDRSRQPDMLEVGNFRSPLNITESRSHFSAWAVTSSPLILGFDVTDSAMVDELWPIISNPEVSWFAGLTISTP